MILNGLFIELAKKERIKCIVVGNHEYKEIDKINSVQSSLKSHLLRVTQLIKIGILGNNHKAEFKEFEPWL